MSKAGTKSGGARLAALPKCPTGIGGLDDITGGGLPRGRPTLVCGGAGCGKTLLGMEFIVRGALQYGEPGVVVSFEEKEDELAQNVRSLGFNLDRLRRQRLLAMDYVRIEPSEIEETGAYDLEGLFVRFQQAMESVGARRLLLDSVESLFAGLGNAGVVRAELRRMLRWFKDRGLTVVVTGERGVQTLTRHGIEEYISDCVLFLDHRVDEQSSIRRLRVMKYRGSTHGTNEYPFLITERGFSILPVTSVRLEDRASPERVSSGLPALDGMLGGRGFYRGSTVLISGTAGTGKTSLAGHFVEGACGRGERCLYVAFEESAGQLVRNLGSIGVHLERHLRSGRLLLRAYRPSEYGLERHLITVHDLVERHGPAIVVLDPATNLLSGGHLAEGQSMLMRLQSWLKDRGITTLLTSLSHGVMPALFESPIASQIDTWIVLRDVEQQGEHKLGLCVVKSRGMPHSREVREYGFGPRGLELKSERLRPL